MNPHTNYVAVGLFMILGVVSFVGLVMWLGKAGETTPMASYVVRIDGAVNGLSNGSIVRYLGVNVGTVVAINLHTEAEPVVEVFIEVDEQLPIDHTTYATLVSQGVTGISNIDLANDPGLVAPQVRHPSGVPVIPFRPSGLNALLSGTGDITQQAQRLLSQLNDWTAAGNRVRAEEILTNLREVSAALAEQRGKVPELVATLERTLGSLEHAALRVESAMDEDWPAMAADLKQTTSNLAAASSRIDAWLARNEASIDRLMGQGLDDAAGLAANLRQVSEALARLSERLREDPSRIVYRAQQDAVVAEP